MNTPALVTKRLILRRFTEKDMKALFLILKDEEVNKFLPWYPLKNLEETRKFYEERYALKYVQPQAYAYAICLKEDNFPIGYVNVIWKNIMTLVMDFGRSFGIGELLQKQGKQS